MFTRFQIRVILVLVALCAFIYGCAMDVTHGRVNSISTPLISHRFERKLSLREQQLFDAIKHYDWVRAREFVENGVSVHTKDDDGYTPLHWAAIAGNKPFCQFLINKGADAGAKADYNFTPLHEAAVNGHAEVCELLLDYGAPIYRVVK